MRFDRVGEPALTKGVGSDSIAAWVPQLVDHGHTTDGQHGGGADGAAFDRQLSGLQAAEGAARWA